MTLPVTVPAAMAGLYIIATRMTAGIAHLRGYDVETDEVRSGILVALLGSAGAAVLRNTGIQVGQRSTAAVLQRLPGRVLTELNQRVGYRLVTKAGEKGVINLTKLVPLVGGPIGAAVDGVSCKTIAGYAMRTFPPVVPRIVRAEVVAQEVGAAGSPRARSCRARSSRTDVLGGGWHHRPPPPFHHSRST